MCEYVPQQKKGGNYMSLKHKWSLVDKGMKD